MTNSYDIVQIFASTLKLRDLSVPDKLTSTDSQVTASAILPIISINGITLSNTDINVFELSCSSFIPTVKIEFKDLQNTFDSDYMITNDSVISIYIAPQTSHDLLPIRCDFTVTSCTVLRTYTYEHSTMRVRSVNGKLRVPDFMKRTSESIKDTSFNALASIARKYKLGFSSNVESSNDEQIWINSNANCDSFIENTLNHSYIDDNSFITGFIDYFYDLNYVEVNRLFEQTDRKANKTMKVFKTQIPVDKIFEESDQTKEVEYMITNKISEDIWNNYFEKYETIMRNQTSEGYKKYVQYYDYDSNEFISEYVDPITNASETMIPISKSRLVNSEVEDNLRDDNIAFTDFGFLCDNVHKNYHFAGVQNNFNLSFCKSFGLKVRLSSYNPAITLYSKLYVDLYDTNSALVSTIKSTDKDDNDDKTVRLTDIDEGLESSTDKNMQVYNESLSGWYVVTGIKLLYNSNNGIMKEELILNRREMKPSVKFQL